MSTDWTWTEAWHARALDRANNPESGPILLRRDLGYALHEIDRLRALLAATAAPEEEREVGQALWAIASVDLTEAELDDWACNLDAQVKAAIAKLREGEA